MKSSKDGACLYDFVKVNIDTVNKFSALVCILETKQQAVWIADGIANLVFEFQQPIAFLGTIQVLVSLSDTVLPYFAAIV